jgi:hypothetical protein
MSPVDKFWLVLTFGWLLGMLTSIVGDLFIAWRSKAASQHLGEFRLHGAASDNELRASRGYTPFDSDPQRDEHEDAGIG